MSPSSLNALRGLPSVNELAGAESLSRWREQLPQSLIVEAARMTIEAARQDIRDGGVAAPNLQTLADRVAANLEIAVRPPLGAVINATGIIIHTGLGRAPLAASVVEELVQSALHYVPVEMDLVTGHRGSRSSIVRPLLCELTGAESATVVNNGAAALLIALSTLARDREVIVSRGELIEIGGSFRLPDVMLAGMAALREVGTTNRTRVADYEAALSERTAALLKVHPSNYVIQGFTEAASLSELTQLAGSAQARAVNGGEPLPVIHDIGSGALTDLSRLNLRHEPSASQSVESGADVVIFSGDKLLGGPQAGIIVGKRDLIDRIERNPLMRALRVDKLTLAALGATLRLHRDARQAESEIPVLSMLATPVETLAARAEQFINAMQDWERLKSVEIVPSTVYMGGGSAPTQGIASIALRLEPARVSSTDFASSLRAARPAVVARVQNDAVLLELRTVFPEQDSQLLNALREVFAT